MGLLGLFFGFQGRANRMQYWIGGILASFIASFTMQMAGSALLLTRPSGDTLPALGATLLIIVAVSLINLWVSIALTVKRLHDRGRTGWIVLVSLVPAVIFGWTVGMAMRSPESMASSVGMIVPLLLVMLGVGLYFFIDLGLLPGVDGPNRYGDPPAGGFMPRRSIGPIDFDAPRGPSRLGGAEAALERAIAERRASKPSVFDPPAAAPRAAPAAAPMRPIVSQAPTFGRRGLT